MLQGSLCSQGRQVCFGAKTCYAVYPHTEIFTNPLHLRTLVNPYKYSQNGMKTIQMNMDFLANL